MNNFYRLLPSLAALLCVAALSGQAAASETPPASSCIDVEVNGQRAPSFACLTQKLQPTPAPRKIEGAPEMASEAIVQRSSNQLGLFNRAATSNRMGNTFGMSVHAQRPPVPQYSSPVVPPR